MTIKINRNLCCYCGGCSAVCPKNALELKDTWLYFEENLCVKCGNCVKVCPVNALEVKT